MSSDGYIHRSLSASARNTEKTSVFDTLFWRLLNSFFTALIIEISIESHPDHYQPEYTLDGKLDEIHPCVLLRRSLVTFLMLANTGTDITFSL